MPPKFVKLATDFLLEASLRFYKHMEISMISISLASAMFLDAVKIAAVIPIVNGTDNKNTGIIFDQLVF